MSASSAKTRRFRVLRFTPKARALPLTPFEAAVLQEFRLITEHSGPSSAEYALRIVYEVFGHPRDEAALWRPSAPLFYLEHKL